MAKILGVVKEGEGDQEKINQLIERTNNTLKQQQQQQLEIQLQLQQQQQREKGGDKESNDGGNESDSSESSSSSSTSDIADFWTSEWLPSVDFGPIDITKATHIPFPSSNSSSNSNWEPTPLERGLQITCKFFEDAWNRYPSLHPTDEFPIELKQRLGLIYNRSNSNNNNNNNNNDANSNSNSKQKGEKQ